MNVCKSRKKLLFSIIFFQNTISSSSSNEYFIETERREEENQSTNPSRQHSHERLEFVDQLIDSPPEFSYEADHTTIFSGGDPTFLGQFYDVTLGSPLLMALSPENYLSSPEDLTALTSPPDTPLVSNQEGNQMSLSTPIGRENERFSYPTRIFYRSPRSSISPGSQEKRGEEEEECANQ